MERLADMLGSEALEETALAGLALEHGKHTPGDTDKREVLVFFCVLVRNECKDLFHRIHVGIVFVAFFGVASDVDTVQVG